MSAFRRTAATKDVLRVLLATTEPSWGLAIVTSTGRPSGTVYPILARLETAGWLRSEWEDAAPSDRPRRRYYSLTDDGRTEAHALLAPAPSRAPAGRAVSIGRTARVALA